MNRMHALAQRRWFQFSLRTLIITFGLLTAALGWLGRELKVIHERNVTREWVVTNGGATISRAQWNPPFGDGGYLVEVPFWRTWLGDQPMVSLKLSGKCMPEDVDRVQAIFPEARVDGGSGNNASKSPIGGGIM